MTEERSGELRRGLAAALKRLPPRVDAPAPDAPPAVVIVEDAVNPLVFGSVEAQMIREDNHLIKTDPAIKKLHNKVVSAERALQRAQHALRAALDQARNEKKPPIALSLFGFEEEKANNGNRLP